MNKKLLVSLTICIAYFSNIFSDGCCTILTTQGLITKSDSIITENESKCKSIANTRRNLSGKIVHAKYNPDASTCN